MSEANQLSKAELTVAHYAANKMHTDYMKFAVGRCPEAYHEAWCNTYIRERSEAVKRSVWLRFIELLSTRGGR